MTHDRMGDDLTLGENFDRLFEKIREVDSKEKKIGSWAIPIALFLIAQFGTSIWWAADISARLVVIEQKVEIGTADRYFGTQAEKDFRIRDDKIEFVQTQIDVLERDVKQLRERIIILEQKSIDQSKK